MLRAQYDLFRSVPVHLRRNVELAVGHPSVAAQKIQGGVGGDARQPVRRLQFVFELILPLKSLNEGLLRKILRVGYIADDTVDLDEDTAKKVGNKPILPLKFLRQ